MPYGQVDGIFLNCRLIQSQTHTERAHFRPPAFWCVGNFSFSNSTRESTKFQPGGFNPWRNRGLWLNQPGFTPG
eukprot:361455-Chlamydomonas_euryale.AAC.10